jgi:branched-chain amino acid transport system substrate-binding protein
MKPSRRRLPAAVAAGGLLCAATACGASNTADARGTGLRSSDSITIGVVVDKTGPSASLGLVDLNGVQLAVDQANAVGGVRGKRIKLDVRDSASDPTTAAAAARTLAKETSVVLGGSTGGACQAMQPILARSKTLQYCFSPQPFTATPLYFWYMAPVSDYVAATMPWLKHRNIHRIAFIGQNDASGTGYLSVFSHLAQQHPDQFEIVANERFNPGATNLEAQMTHIRNAHPDLIVAGTSGGNIVPAVQAAKALGMKQPIWVGTGSASTNSLKALANDLPQGGLFTNAFWVDVARQTPDSVLYADKVKAFAAVYTDKYRQAPVNTAAGAYDATRQIIGVLKAGATTGMAMARYLERTPFTGVLGDYTFNSQRHQGASMVPTMMKYTGNSGFRLAFSAA